MIFEASVSYERIYIIITCKGKRGDYQKGNCHCEENNLAELTVSPIYHYSQKKKNSEMS